jgi:hypothetical protein
MRSLFTSTHGPRRVIGSLMLRILTLLLTDMRQSLILDMYQHVEGYRLFDMACRVLTRAAMDDEP